MTAITLWGVGTPRSLRPIWVAEELGIRYEHRPIGPRTGETRTPEFTRLNPRQKIPFLVDGDMQLSESVAICRYLLNAYPGGTVYRPDTVASKAREDEWCCYIFGELDETSLYVMRRHGDLASIYGASDTAVSAAASYLERHLAVIAKHLEGRQYLLEPGFSLPDLLLVSCLDWALFYGLALPPVVAQYRDSIATRPAYESAMRTNYPELFDA
jgi:glutathione S-transferase